MLALKGIYNNGMIDLIEKPNFQNPIEVLIIFPEEKKEIKKIGGLFKNTNIDYEQVAKDLKELHRNSEKHIINDWKEGR